MKDYLKLATSSPNILLKDIIFWASQKIFIGIVIFSVVIIFLLIGWTYPEKGGWISYLSIPIHFLAFWGIVVAAKAISKINIEQAIAFYVEEKASEELRKIKSGSKSRIELDSIENDFLPHNPSPEIQMIRLYQHILKEAKDRKFESSVIVMEPYREESMGNIFKLQIIQRSALQLGILGTFIGLIGALQELEIVEGGLLDIRHFEGLIGSLHIAFSTSVAGLEVSVIIGILMMLVKRVQEKYFQTMEDSTVTMLSLARNAINKDELFNELGQIRSSVDQLSERVYDQSQEIGTLTNEIQSGINKLGESRSEFDNFLIQVKEKQDQFIDEMKRVYELISPEKFSAELKVSLTKAVDNISTTISNSMEKDLKKLDELNNTLSLLNSGFEKVQIHFEKHVELMEKDSKKLSQTKSDFDTSLTNLSKLQKEFVEKVDNWVKDLPKNLQKNIRSVGSDVSREFNLKLKEVVKEIGSLSSELDRLNGSISKTVSPTPRKSTTKRSKSIFSWFSK